MPVRLAAIIAGLLLTVTTPAGAVPDIVYPALEEPAHKPLFHNDKIDVYDVQLQPGQSSFYHRHSRDQLGIILRSGTSLNQAQGDAEISTRNERGAIAYIPHSALGGYIHRVSAVNDPFRVIGVEFSKPAPPGAKPAIAAPDQSRFLFPQGQATRLTISPGETQAISGSLIVAMAPGELGAAGSEKWTFDEGAVQWIENNMNRMYSNRTLHPVHLLILTIH